MEHKFCKFLVGLIVISLAISPSFALGEENINMLLIGVLSFSPVIILIYGKINIINPWLAFFMTSIIVIPWIHHPTSFRWTTVLYSNMFCLNFLAYKSLLSRNYLTSHTYLSILRFLILAYFAVLVIQQFCVLTGLPIINVSNYSIAEPWKLNSLASEPSHSARIIALLLYCYITVKELHTNREYSLKYDMAKDKWVWLSFIWSMITMGSGTAFLFLFLIFLKFFRLKNLLPIYILTILIIILINLFEITSFERTYNTAIATLTLNENTIIETDHSASIRIVPIIILSKIVTLYTMDGWFGHGIDYVGGLLSDIIPGIPEGTTGGGLLYLWVEYGFITFICFIIFTIIESYRKGDLLSLLFWFMLVFLSGVNNQITWLCILLLSTNKYLFEKKIFYEKNNFN
jgi:hypothetical protein